MNDKTTNNDTIGAVLVVGAGIAGVQASLDLGDAGYKVYLVEKAPGIGGNMARLDKTFPTNDCSMCILSPKLVDCARHTSVELSTSAEVMDVTGEPGHFTATIRHHAKYIDPKKCTACGDCAEVCPMELPDAFNCALDKHKATFKLYAQSIPNAYVIDRRMIPFCQAACPADTSAQGYVALIRQKRYRDAHDVILETNPFPSICGRVCHHPCERSCRRGLVDEPVGIMDLKRFVADYVYEHNPPRETPLPEPDPEERKKRAAHKVAVVGAGPGGLTAAYRLKNLGYQVKLFEAGPKPGGMMLAGIPRYRLPGDVLAGEIERTLEGVEVAYNTPITETFNLDTLKEQGFEAVFLAVGSAASRMLRIDGYDMDGVVWGLEFLRQIGHGERPQVGRHVVVIGGGNVAIDAARSALRMGAESVRIVYRRTREEMPATDEEVEEALEEGLPIEFLLGPVRFVGNGTLTGMECVRMKLGEPDASGRRRPEPIEGSEHTIDTDMAILAIGQESNLEFLRDADGVTVNRNGTIQADPLTMATSAEGVFTGGDIATGPATVIGAVAAGNRAARSIDNYLMGQSLELNQPPLKREAPRPSDEPLDQGEQRESPEDRQHPAVREPQQRTADFGEVRGALTEQQALLEAARCLGCGLCSDCRQCEKVCRAGAINFDDVTRDEQVQVGAVILAAGFEEFDPSAKYHFGYGKYADVITSMEFERILSASGPFQGHVVRPSDHKPAKRIAWVQCVGSRDTVCGNGYCSAVCCTYAIKEAIVAKEHAGGDVDATIYYYDLRTFGKDFDKYAIRAQEEYGVDLVRSGVSKVERDDATGDLVVHHLRPDGTCVEDRFDVVVLSVGLGPSKAVRGLADRVGVRMDRNGFVQTAPGEPLRTSRDGVFVCGALSAPKDVPETVVQASGAAGQAGAMLASARDTLVTPKQYPPERDVAGEPPRIGVFVCHCGINIGGVVDVPSVKDYAATLAGVAFAEENMYTCSQDTQEKIKEQIIENGLNRVVVASCSPRTHEPLFQETMRDAGLNPHLFAMANIRDQCSWVHQSEKAAATEKSKDLVRMAVVQARLLKPLHSVELPVTQKCLVVGGGLAGMTAAQAVADQGYDVFLVEREPELGGNLRRLYTTVDGQDVQQRLADMIARIEADPRITAYTGSTVAEINGYVGNYKATVQGDDGAEPAEVEFGTVILATGGNEYQPTEYLYGRHDDVVTQLEFEKELVDTPDTAPTNIVMIQCVGSRQEGRQYCSRVCCATAIKNALRAKRQNPEANVYIVYRDIRTYGLYEQYYRQAREAGVVFLEFDPDDPPVAEPCNGHLKVTVLDQVLGQRVELPAHRLVLSAGVLPEHTNEQLAMMLKVPVNGDGFFLEAHVKLRPVDFATEGVFMAGLAHAPKNINETIGQAHAAAARATTVLVHDKMQSAGKTAQVNPAICSGCGLCELVCAFGAIAVNPEWRVAEVNEGLCKGCGACAASCRAAAVDLGGYANDQLLAAVEGVLL